MRRPLHLSLFAAACCCAVGLTAAPEAARRAAAQDPPGPTPAGLELAARLIDASQVEPQELLKRYAERIDVDLRRGLITQSNRLMAERRFADALRGYDLARQVAERIGDRRGAAAAMIGIGTIHGRLGDYKEAALSLRAGLAISEEIDEGPNSEAALNNLGIVSRLQGEYRRALTLAETLARPANIARTLTNIGIVHMLRGSYREALQYYQQSLRLKEATKQTADIPSTLASIGNVYARMGDAELALEYYQRSVKLDEQLGNRAATAEALNDIGPVHADQRRYDLALGYSQRALSLLEASGGKAEIAATLQDYGHLHRARGDLSGAMKYFRRSLAIRESINDRPGTADALVEVAGVLHREGDRSAALEAARRAARVAGETGRRETFWRARLVEGEVHEALGQIAAATEAYSEAVDVIEKLRGDAAGFEQERQRFLEGKLAPFQHLAGLLVAEGRAADALGVAERAKARVMLDVLRAGRATTGC